MAREVSILHVWGEWIEVSEREERDICVKEEKEKVKEEMEESKEREQKRRKVGCFREVSFMERGENIIEQEAKEDEEEEVRKKRKQQDGGGGCDVEAIRREEEASDGDATMVGAALSGHRQMTCHRHVRIHPATCRAASNEAVLPA